MTFGALVGFVTVTTYGVNLHLASLGFLSWFEVVAVRTVFLLVAVNTPQTEQLDMLLMEKSHHLAIRIRSPIDFCCGNSYHRMGDAHQVGRVY